MALPFCLFTLMDFLSKFELGLLNENILLLPFSYQATILFLDNQQRLMYLPTTQETNKIQFRMEFKRPTR